MLGFLVSLGINSECFSESIREDNREKLFGIYRVTTTTTKIPAYFDEVCQSKINNSGKIYCSIKCQQQYGFRNKINHWQGGLDDGYETNGTVRRYIKRYLIEKAGYKCSECGWNKINTNTNKCPLEIHHIDGNYKNNVESNLQVLCPNCHSLTDTYKNMNKGNGRECRK